MCIRDSVRCGRTLGTYVADVRCGHTLRTYVLCGRTYVADARTLRTYAADVCCGRTLRTYVADVSCGRKLRTYVAHIIAYIIYVECASAHYMCIIRAYALLRIISAHAHVRIICARTLRLRSCRLKARCLRSCLHSYIGGRRKLPQAGEVRRPPGPAWDARWVRLGRRMVGE